MEVVVINKVQRVLKLHCFFRLKHSGLKKKKFMNNKNETVENDD